MGVVEACPRRQDPAGQPDNPSAPPHPVPSVMHLGDGGFVRSSLLLLLLLLRVCVCVCVCLQVLMEYHTKKPDVKLHQGESFTSHVDAIVKALQDFTG